MPNYHRFRVDGGTYFFTVVTYHRRPFLVTPAARAILRDAWQRTTARYPFETLAICLLPDHLHCILKLPTGDADYAKRWKMIKNLFTVRYLKEIGDEEERNLSRQKRHEAAIWQRRFWEHTILDEDDFDAHMDYIHFNPIKHGLVDRAADWQWSSFHRYVRDGYYDIEWMGGDDGRLQEFDHERWLSVE